MLFRSSLIVTVVSWLLSHGRATFDVAVGAPTAATVVAALTAVPVFLVLGAGARSLWAWFRAHRLPSTWALPVGIGAAGALTGAASLWLPVLPGNGRDALEAALASPTTRTAMVALAGVMVLKPLLTGATLRTGATGGLLAPSFALGGSAGSGPGGRPRSRGRGSSSAWTSSHTLSTTRQYRGTHGGRTDLGVRPGLGTDGHPGGCRGGTRGMTVST